MFCLYFAQYSWFISKDNTFPGEKNNWRLKKVESVYFGTKERSIVVKIILHTRTDHCYSWKYDFWNDEKGKKRKENERNQSAIMVKWQMMNITRTHQESIQCTILYCKKFFVIYITNTHTHTHNNGTYKHNSVKQ